MKNSTQAMDQPRQIKIPDWMYQEIQDDDFLMGKTPQDVGNIEEEEE